MECKIVCIDQLLSGHSSVRNKKKNISKNKKLKDVKENVNFFLILFKY